MKRSKNLSPSHIFVGRFSIVKKLKYIHIYRHPGEGRDKAHYA